MAQEPVPEKETIRAEENVSKKEDKQSLALKIIAAKIDKTNHTNPDKEKTGFSEKDDNGTGVGDLFHCYRLDDKADRLQPQDIRKLLLDILQVMEFPLVVPDEALQAVLKELCLNDEGNVSFVEFKSFFVFLQDSPLNELFNIITKDKVKLNKKQIGYSRLITIRPVRAKQDDDNKGDDNNDNNNEVDGDGDGDASKPKDNDDQKASQSEDLKLQNYYDRKKWESAVQNLIPEATQIFIYFKDGYQILALAISDKFDAPLSEPAAAEVKLDDVTYLATIRAFDVNNDMFPPIARSGGMKSKVARKIADSYLIARQWDEKHLKLVEKTGKLAHTISIKWTEFDEKYKVNERVNATTTSIINSVKAFDEKHQLTRRLSSGAKSFNEKFGITDKLGSVADKISSNEKVQIVSNKVNESFKAAVKTIDDIGTETQQLVQEKRQQQNDGSKNEDDNNQQQNEGGGQQQQQQQQAQPPQEYGANDNNNDDTAPVEVGGQ